MADPFASIPVENDPFAGIPTQIAQDIAQVPVVTPEQAHAEAVGQGEQFVPTTRKDAKRFGKNTDISFIPHDQLRSGAIDPSAPPPSLNPFDSIPPSNPFDAIGQTSSEQPQQPDWLSSMATHLGKGVLGVEQTGAQLGDALTGGVFDLQSKVPKFDPTQPLTVSDEQAKAESLPQKIVGGAVEALPGMVAAMGVGGAVGAVGATAERAKALSQLGFMGAFGVESALPAGREMLDQGVDMKTAMAVSGVAGAMGIGTARIPMVGKSLAQTIGLSASTNPLIGAADDLSKKLLLQANGYDQQAANYNPLDWEKRGVEAATGLLMGGVMHVAEYNAANRLNAKVKALLDDHIAADEWSADLFNRMGLGAGNVLPPVKDRFVPPAGMGWEDASKLALHGGKVSNLLDLYSQHEEIPPYVRAVADTLRRFVDIAGLGDLQVLDRSDQDAHARGSYAPRDTIDARGNTLPSDSIVIYSGFAKTTIPHEIIHALAGGALDLHTLKLQNDPRYTDHLADIKANDPDGSREAQFNKLMDTAGTIKDIYSAARDRFESTLDGAERDKYLKAHMGEGAWSDTSYGFKNAEEFITESMTRKAFAENLRKMELTAEEKTKWMTLNKTRPQNMWQAVKTAMRTLFGGDEGPIKVTNPTMYEAAFEHVTHLFELQDPQSRVGIGNDRVKETARQRVQQRSAKDAEFRSQLSDDTLRTSWSAIRNLLINASSEGMFVDRLRAMSDHPAWNDFVVKYGESLWQNGEHMIQAIGPDTGKTMGPNDIAHAWADNNAVPGEFFPKLFAELSTKDGTARSKFKTQEDIWDEFTDMGTKEVLGIMKSAFTDPKAVGGRVAKWFGHQMSNYLSLEKQLTHRALKDFTEFYSKPAVDQAKIMQHVLHWDNQLSGRADLIMQGLQWPTKEMLMKDQGRYATALSEEHANIYLQMTKGLDFMHNLINQARTHLGLPPIEKIPGYFPHVHKGDFRVFIEVTNPYTGQTGLSHVWGGPTAWHAKWKISQLERGGENYTDASGREWKFKARVDPESGKAWQRLEPTTFDNSLAMQTQDYLEASRNFSDFPPEVQEFLQNTEAKAQGAFTKHMLDRTDIGGFLGWAQPGKNPLKEGLFADWGLSKSNNRIANVFHDYVRNVASFYKNTMFMKEVFEPTFNIAPTDDNPNVWGHVFENTEKLQRYMRELSANFTGAPLNKLEWLDRELAITFADMFGLSPNALKDTSRYLRNFLSATMLRMNPGFYLGNLFQAGNAMAILSMANVHLTKGGMKNLPEPIVSFAKTLKNLPEPSPEMQAALQWAQDRHLLQDRLADAMANTQNPTALGKFLNYVTLGKVNPAIEKMGRTLSFQVGYQHFRDAGYTIEQARQAAETVVGMTMINYDKTSRPLMFQNYGVAGASVAPFAVFRNGYIGNMLTMVKAIRLDPTNLSSYKPLLYNQLFYLVTAGVVGAPFVQETEMIIDWINKLYPELPIQHISTYMQRAKVPDYVAFGSISAATKSVLPHGAYMGASLNAVTMDEGLVTAMVPFMDAIASLAPIVGRQIGSTAMPDTFAPVTNTEVQAAGNQMLGSTPQKALFQYMMNPQDSQVGTKPGSSEGYVEKDSQDWLVQFLTGRLSLKEYKDRAVEAGVEQRDKRREETLKRLVSVATDYAVNPPMGAHGDLDKVVERAVSLFSSEDGAGLTEEEFMTMVAAEAVARRTTVAQRDAAMATIRGVFRQRIRDEQQNPQ